MKGFTPRNIERNFVLHESVRSSRNSMSKLRVCSDQEALHFTESAAHRARRSVFVSVV